MAETHWTTRSLDDLRHSVGADFLVQVEKAMGAQGITKAVLAEKMQVSRSAITQLLSELRNNNFTLDTLLGLSGAVGLQCAIVLYQTPNEDGAPVYAEIFARCWERVGKPKDFWELNDGDIK